jgi:hypothetical protein
MKILFSVLREDVVAAEAKICQNCGIPDGRGTERWSDIKEFEEGFFIGYPDNGWGGFTVEQMLDGVENVNLRDITVIDQLEQ